MAHQTSQLRRNACEPEAARRYRPHRKQMLSHRAQVRAAQFINRFTGLRRRFRSRGQYCDRFAEIANVESMLLSGVRATFTLKSGHYFSEKEVAEALEDKGLALASFRKEERSRAINVYELGIKPVT